MRIFGLIVSLALSVSACTPSVHRQVRDYNRDGILLFTHQRYEPARQTFARALKLKPGDPDLLFNLGQCYDRQGEIKQAEKTYLACLNESPRHTAARHALIHLLVRDNRPKEARQRVQKWIQSQPRDADAYALDGWLYFKDGDLPLAQGRLQQALQLNPRNDQALVSLGQVYEAMQRKNRALILYQRALRINSDQPEVFKKVRRLRKQGARPPRPDL